MPGDEGGARCAAGLDAAMGERRPRRALVIEDEPHVRDIWCEYLAVLGYDADPMADGETGLAAFRTFEYSIVVTDLRLRGLTGQAVARTIGKLNPDVGVIFVTGSVSDEETAALRGPGVAVLQKPVRLGEFQRAVERCLSARVPQATPARAARRTMTDNVVELSDYEKASRQTERPRPWSRFA